MSRLFYDARKAYFFSSGFDSLGEAGKVEVVVDGELPMPPGEVVVDGELPMPPAELEEAAPVPPGVVVASAFGASAGAGVGVAIGGGVVGAVDAGGGGGVTTFSSFLQAVRPTATSAAIRSERFMCFPLGEGRAFNRIKKRAEVFDGKYPAVMTF